MAVAPLPTPSYIDYLDNVQPYIGTDKILVSDTDSTAIPTSLANQLVAAGEALALEDLSPYYVTVPELITTTGGDWTTLPNFTYDTLYYMFVIQASLKLIGNFIARNTDEMGRTLSYFQEFYASEYARYLNRITDMLPNGAYRYQLIGLQPVNTGIQRISRNNVRSGTIGAANNYTGNQITNPQTNFNGPGPYGQWPYGVIK